MIIAIDGPSASGKSTTARGVAERLGIRHLDTGAMYRAVTLGIIDYGINLDDHDRICEFLEELEISFDSLNDIWANGDNVTRKIRTIEISSNVSAVSAIPQVREKLVAIQRVIAESFDCVLEGRDIGTVVFPNADYKFFLIADLEIRAKRRLVELEKIGEFSSLSELKSDIQNRDRLDTSRNISPLFQAEDAITIDTGNLTIDEQIEIIVEIINK
tara:strand:- start:127 stop:771 length:645 start_codon:yes stop_codon:yes gene_type:complete